MRKRQPKRFVNMVAVAPLIQFCRDAKQVHTLAGRVTDFHTPSGFISVIKADKIACKLGVHPYSIWGEAFYEESEAWLCWRETIND